MRSVLLLLALLALAACDSSTDGPARAGDTVTVRYIGSLADGTVFDQSDRATFNLGGVIPGFRDGIVGMVVGEQRVFDIPPDQAYGATPPPGSGIPPNATLTFDVTLLGIR